MRTWQWPPEPCPPKPTDNENSGTVTTDIIYMYIKEKRTPLSPRRPLIGFSRGFTGEHGSSGAWKWSRSDVDCSLLIKVTCENSVNVLNLFIVLSELYTEVSEQFLNGTSAHYRRFTATIYGRQCHRISCQCDWLWIVGNLAALGFSCWPPASLDALHR